jgi:hypothetical protein
MSDGRDAWGRPIFSHGLGVGDRWTLGEHIDRGAKIIHDLTPVPEWPDPHVHTPEEGYGADGVLGVRFDPHSMGAKVLPPDWKRPAAPLPPPMGGMHRHNAPGDPAAFGSTPLDRVRGVQTYGGTA